MDSSVKGPKDTSMDSQSPLTICEYHPGLRERVLSLFTSGMADNKANVEDRHTRNRVNALVNRVTRQFEDLEAFLHSKNGGKMFLAKTPSDDIVGMFAVLRSDENMQNEEVEFSRISVASSWRRKGVCRLLHDHAVRYSRDILAAKTAYLITLSSVTPGMRTYTALGFREGFDNALDRRGFDMEEDAPILVKFWKPLL